MTSDTVLFEETVAQRQALVDVLASLSQSQWDSPTACTGWRVREVVAHVTMPYRHSPLKIVAALLRSRGDFDRAADRLAKRDTADHPSDDLLDALRDNVTNRWKPPGGGQLGALSHDVIHGLDITEALGVSPVSPPARLATVLRNSKLHSTFAADISGYRLEATDADYHLGHGEVVQLPAKDVLLICTGRKALRPE